MRNMMKMTLAAAALIATATMAQAQTTCKGKVFVDSVYQNATSTAGQFEYTVQVRNQSSVPVTFSINFGGFPTTVSLFSPILPGVKLEANKNQSIKFGKGTNQQINTGTVKVQYDTTSSTGKPTVSVTGCK